MDARLDMEDTEENGLSPSSESMVGIDYLIYSVLSIFITFYELIRVCLAKSNNKPYMEKLPSGLRGNWCDRPHGPRGSWCARRDAQQSIN